MFSIFHFRLEDLLRPGGNATLFFCVGKWVYRNGVLPAELLKRKNFWWGQQTLPAI